MCNVWVCVIVVFLLSCHRLVVHRCYQRELRKDEKKKRKAEMWDNNNSNNDNKPKMQQLVLYCDYEDNKQRGRKREGEKRQERKRKKKKKKNGLAEHHGDAWNSTTNSNHSNRHKSISFASFTFGEQGKED